ncbi:hypothetical protein Bca101_043954 [Brassica carinata]
MSSPSAVSDRASDSTDDNIPLIRRPIPRCDGSGFLWRSVRTTPVHEGSSGRVPVRQLVDEDVIDLEDDDVEPQEGGDHPMGLLRMGVDDGGRSAVRGRGSAPPPRLPSPTPSCSTMRSPSVRVGGVRQAIPAYVDVLNSAMAGSSFGGDGGMAKSSPFSDDTEPEREVGESNDAGPVAPGSGGLVRPARDIPPTATGFMADAIRSSAWEARTRGFLKRPSKGVSESELPREKRPRRNLFARLFRYDEDVPLVNDERACADFFFCARSDAVSLPDADDLVHAQEFKDMARSDTQAKAHALRVVHLYERDLKRARRKLEDMFAEKELRDDKIKELEKLVMALTLVAEKAASEAESLRADLSASLSHEAILRAQIGDQKSSLGARIDYLERSHEEYAAREVARAICATIEKYQGCLERVRAYLSDQERVWDLVFRENQMTGIVSCLEACIREGILILREKLEHHEGALREFTRLLDSTEVAVLDVEDLVLSPHYSPSCD